MTTPLTGVAGTLPLPNTTVAPIPGEPVQAAHVQVPVQALLDQDATLEATMLPLSGGTMTGAVTLAGIPQTLVLPPGGTIQIQPGGSIVVPAGAEIFVSGLLRLNSAAAELRVPSASFANMYGRTRIRGPADLADADHTLYDTVTGGNQYVRLATPSATRTIILPEPAAWLPSTAYTSGVSIVKNAGNIYTCSLTGVSAPSGGPTGTGTGIVDGSAEWDFQGLAPVDGDWYRLTAAIGISSFAYRVRREGSILDLAYLGPTPAGDAGAGTTNNRVGNVLVRYNGTVNHWQAIDIGGRVGYYGNETVSP